MAGFISQQPNGKYCRFSTTVDCPTHINMELEDYVNVVMAMQHLDYEFAMKEAQDVINNYLRPFNEVINRYIPNNMSQKMFLETMKKMVDENGVFEVIGSDPSFKRAEINDEYHASLNATYEEANRIVNSSIRKK